MIDRHILFVGIFIGGLDEKITTEVLYSAFIPFGEVRNVQIPVDPKTGKIRGFGFVEFAEIDDAQEAKENMNNAELFGRVLRVTVSKPTKIRLEGQEAGWVEVDTMNPIESDESEEEEEDKNEKKEE